MQDYNKIEKNGLEQRKRKVGRNEELSDAELVHYMKQINEKY